MLNTRVYRIKEQGGKFQVEYLQDELYNDGFCEMVVGKKWVNVGSTRDSLKGAKLFIQILKKQEQVKRLKPTYYDEDGKIIKRK